MQLKGFYLCHNRRGFCCFGLQLPAALWAKKFHTHEIYWATIWKAFPHIFSMKAFLKYKLSHKRLFGFMKHAVLGKKEKEKESTKPNHHQNWAPHGPSMFCILSMFIFSKFSNFQKFSL